VLAKLREFESTQKEYSSQTSGLLIPNSVNSLAKTSAYQLQRTDIRVNTVCPGLIETGMTEGAFEYARGRGTAGKIGQLNPLARFGVAEGSLKLIAYVVT
jgi:NAD(P)-dependent dehydrogenase (short-subunit alcohol dehydrogenase family)